MASNDEWIAERQPEYERLQAGIKAVRVTSVPQLSSADAEIAMDKDHFPRVLSTVPLATRGHETGSFKWAWSNPSIPESQRFGAVAFNMASERFEAPILTVPDTFELAPMDAEQLFGALAVAFDARGLVTSDLGTIDVISLVVGISEPAEADVAADIWRSLFISFLNASMVLPFNALRRALPDFRLDLTNLDLRGRPQQHRGDLHVAILREHGMLSNFASLQLAGIDLSEVRLDETQFGGADLTDANLSGAILIDTDLSQANLTSAQLDFAWLHNTNFNDALLTRTSFAGAEMSGTLLTDVDLSTATGLDTVRHSTESDVSFSTLVNSRFRIPQKFLRKSGVSIGLLQDLRRGGRIETNYGSCFISFSSVDRNFAERLEYGLAASGVRTFLDENNLVPGMDLDTQFMRAVREHDHVITVLSDASMTSAWVARETDLALQHRPEGYIPVRLCALEPVRAWYFDTFGTDETQSRLILSFENWEDEARFDRQLRRLLDGLAR